MSGGLVHCTKESLPIFFFHALLSSPVEILSFDSRGLAKTYYSCLVGKIFASEKWRRLHEEGKRKIVKVKWKENTKEKNIDEKRDRTTKLAYCDTVSLALLRYYFFFALVVTQCKNQLNAFFIVSILCWCFTREDDKFRSARFNAFFHRFEWC